MAARNVVGWLFVLVGAGMMFLFGISVMEYQSDAGRLARGVSGDHAQAYNELVMCTGLGLLLLIIGLAMAFSRKAQKGLSLEQQAELLAKLGEKGNNES